MDRCGKSSRWHNRAAVIRQLSMTAALVAVGLALGAGERGDAAQPAVTIETLLLLPDDLVLAEAGETGASAVRLGGLSDLLAEEPNLAAGHEDRVCWTLTDRGPNGTVETAEGKRRTLLNPDFQPTLLAFQLPSPAGQSGREQSVGRRRADHPVKVVAKLPLRGRSGTPVTGRPNGVGRDEPILNPAGTLAIAPDHNGVDSEGLVRMPDGSFWMCEEYRPSLLRVSREGVVLSRHVPAGVTLGQADYEVRDNLPARYGSRKDNRGFEAVTRQPGSSLLWVLLQSPLEFPKPKAAKQTGNTRLLAFETVSGQPVGEYIYRLGDPQDPRYATMGAAPDDGKLCAMAAIDADSMLVLEQSDDGIGRLYRCSLQHATNTLEDERPLETIADLSAAGVEPVRKTLVADLKPLLAEMAADITAGAWRPGPNEVVAGLKLEGLAILDSHHILLCNDNDFDIDAASSPGSPHRRNCVWVLRLTEPLAGFGD